MAQIGLCICNDFDYEIVNFQFLDGDVPRSTSYGVYISQLIPPKFVLLEHLAMLLLLYLRAPPLIYSGHKSVELKYWLVYNKSSVLVIIIYTWCSKYIQLLITVFVGSLELSQCHHSFHM